VSVPGHMAFHYNLPQEVWNSRRRTLRVWFAWRYLPALLPGWRPLVSSSAWPGRTVCVYMAGAWRLRAFSMLSVRVSLCFLRGLDAYVLVRRTARLLGSSVLAYHQPFFA